MDVHGRGQACQRRPVLETDPGLFRRHPQRPVEGTAVEKMPAQPLRQQLADGAFAGTARAVDG